ncbi:hypothetical protein VNI00_010233 [Paramarasmius palmivorus]|uniref:Uncharacterized protein n=1 Tax=Paramarasmius palmivorus TaxID=297713 RepID=A0AAW0BXL4_9AGAR
MVSLNPITPIPRWINIVNAFVVIDDNPKVISSTNPEFLVKCQHDESESYYGPYPFRIQLQASANPRDIVVGHENIDKDANCSSPIRITFDSMMSTGSFDIELMTLNM